MDAAKRVAWILVLALGCGGSGGSGAGTQEVTLKLLEGTWKGQYLGSAVFSGTVLGLPIGIGPHYDLRAEISRTSDDLAEGTLWAYNPYLLTQVDAGRIAIAVVTGSTGGEYVRVSIYLPNLHVSETYDLVSVSDMSLRAESDSSSVQLHFDAAE